MNILERLNNYIKKIVNEAIDERKSKEEEYEYAYSLPEVKKNELLACSIQKTHADLIPSAPAGVAMDAACPVDKLNNAYNICNPVNDVIYTHFATQGFIGFQACAILSQNWLINKACSQPAKDAIRPAYELSYVTTENEEEIDKDFLTEITDLSNDRKGFNIKNICSIFEQKKKQFGQVLAFPIIDGVNYEEPFNIDAVSDNSYRGMTVVDPVWYTPILDVEAVSDPTSLRYMKPTYFQMPDGKKIHHSWCIFGVNGEISDVLKPTYYFGGYPIPQLIYERVYCAEKTANEAHMLAQSKRLLVADINVKGYMTNPEATTKELTAITQFRDNWGVMTKRPGDSVQQIDTSLTDLDEVIMTQYQLVAAAACVPATKLLETQPKGFNSTGDYEDKQYKLTLVEIQNADYIPILDFHYALLSKSKYGITRNYTITFKEIDTPTELERAQINQTKAQTDSVYVQAGILSPDEVRDNLIKDPNSGYNDIQGEYEDSDLEGSESLGELIDNPSIAPGEAATLNGIQVSSMVNIASQVAKGELSRESAIAILEKSFNLTEQEASAIIGEQQLPDEQGGSSNEQSPFSEDEEPERWITTKNDVKVPVSEGENNEEACEEFFEEKQEEKQEKKEQTTSQEEKQKKINSVNIDPAKDNILPELNKEQQEFLGVSNYPVRLKKKIFEINQKHNDVNKGDDNYIIGSALYDPENVIPAKTQGYYHFIKRVHDNRNSLVLLDVNVNKNEGYLDVVHYYYTDDKGRKRTQKNH